MAVTHDQTAILPLIRSAIAARNQGGSEGNDGIRIVASPWSPPAWMKVPRMAPDVSASNGSAAAVVETLQQSMLGSASPNGLQADVIVQRTWANYISRFVEAYNQQGVPIWAVTPQNEPEFAAPWEACAYTPQYEQEFIAEHLGPVLKADHPEVLLLKSYFCASSFNLYRCFCSCLFWLSITTRTTFPFGQTLFLEILAQ